MFVFFGFFFVYAFCVCGREGKPQDYSKISSLSRLHIVNILFTIDVDPMTWPTCLSCFSTIKLIPPHRLFNSIAFGRRSLNTFHIMGFLYLLPEVKLLYLLNYFEFVFMGYLSHIKILMYSTIYYLEARCMKSHTLEGRPLSLACG